MPLLICQTAVTGDAGKRLDLFVKEYAVITRSAAQNLLEQGGVTVNGRVRPKNYVVAEFDRVEISVPEPAAIEAKPQDIPIAIVYQDFHLAVINKPKGMVVHPAPGNWDKTLVNALLYHMSDSLSGINGQIRPGIVHRIDKDTSGLLIVAKTDRAHEGLAAQIKEHSFTRRYQSVVAGHLNPSHGSVDKPIGRCQTDRKKMAVYAPGTPNARPAVTRYRTLEEFGGSSHVELELETGRTHQIRVHMASLGHPVAGDEVYGGRRMCEMYPWLEGQCLHAKYIAFVHPASGERMAFDSPLPDYFALTIEKLRKV